MSKQMRDAIEKAKAYYIQKLLELEEYQSSNSQLNQLTLTELQFLYKKVNKPGRK